MTWQTRIHPLFRKEPSFIQFLTSQIESFAATNNTTPSPSPSPSPNSKNTSDKNNNNSNSNSNNPKTKKDPKIEHPELRTHSLYPELHKTITALLAPTTTTFHEAITALFDQTTTTPLHFDFHNKDTPKGIIKERPTSVMGRFRCHNPACSSRGWPSKAITTMIRLYPNERYNARIYHQRCKQCKTLSRPVLDGSYAERVVRQLKIWKGVKVEEAVYMGRNEGPPHQQELCEGCKAKCCPHARE